MEDSAGEGRFENHHTRGDKCEIPFKGPVCLLPKKGEKKPSPYNETDWEVSFIQMIFINT